MNNTDEKKPAAVQRGRADDRIDEVTTSSYHNHNGTEKRKFQRAESLTVNPDGIPDDLKRIDRWLVWKTFDEAGKVKKVPYSVHSGKACDPTAPDSWCSFDKALAAYKTGKHDGIGIALGDGDDTTVLNGRSLVGVDLDDCREPKQGELNPPAQKIVEMMDTYTEVSPSGNGVKLFCLVDADTLPVGSKTKNKKGTVEVYTRSRFFAVTGHRLSGHLGERSEQLSDVWREHIGSELKSPIPQSAARDSVNGHIGSAALAAMLKIKLPAEAEGDGSKRLHAVCCRAVEHSLSDEATIATVREYEKSYPFPQHYDDRQILNRVRDAERNVDRGSAIKFHHITDAGNALRFAEQHGADVRFCHAWNKWLVWDGRRWAIDTTGEIMQRAKKTARSIYVEASKSKDKQDAERLAIWAKQSEGRHRLAAMILLSQSEPGIPIAVEALDAKSWLFNCENGTLDLKTGRLCAHRRDDFLTALCPIKYPDETAAAPTLWMEFLNRIFEGNQSLIQFVQHLLGISLVGEVQEHILPIFYGTGSNGKSTLIESWCELLGPDYSLKAPHGLLMARMNDKHPTELADLHGKRFVAVAETDFGKRLSEALVKELTGGDTIRARRMQENFWQFRPSHTIVLATNHKPTVRGTDHAIWRRLRLLPFSVTIPDSEADKELKTKLQAEWAAILKWAVEGCIDWQRNGLQAPDDVLSATQEYRNDSDVLGKFIDEHCVVETNAKASATDLFQAYKKWAEDGYQFIENQTQFGLLLSERGFSKRKSSGLMVYRGIALRPAQA